MSNQIKPKHTGLGMQCCTLCGAPSINLTHTMESNLVKDVLQKCFTPTKYAYQSIYETPGNTLLYFCEQCFVVIKRKSNALVSPRKTMLTTDQFIFFLLHPGLHPIPDVRNIKRMYAAFTQKRGIYENKFLSFAPVKRIISHIQSLHGVGEISQREVVQKLVKTWLILNGNPIFFKSKRVGRLMRGVLRDSDEALDDGPQRLPANDDVFSGPSASDDNFT
eukprot:1907925-Rhodomonas_salina.1